MFLTPNFRVDNAIRYVQQETGSLYLVIAHRNTWSSADGTYGQDGVNPPSDSNVPQVQPGTVAFSDPICAFKATPMWIVENDETGTYGFTDANGNLRLFSQLTTAAAVQSAMSNLVMLIGTIVGSNVLTITSQYRQFGFAVGLTPATGHTNDTFLPPSNIVSWGSAEAIQNRTPVNLVSDTSNQIKIIIPA